MRFMLICMVVLIGVGCSETKVVVTDQRHDSLIVLDQGNTEKIKTAKDLLTLDRSIELEFTPECMISKVRRLIINDSHIVVIDKKNPLPLVFDHNGKYRCTIGKIGRGPGEIADNSWTEANDSMVMVLSNPHYGINCYSYSNQFLRFIDLKSTQRISHRFCWSDPSLLLIYGFFQLSYPILSLYSPSHDSLVTLWTPISEREKKRTILGDCVLYNVFHDYEGNQLIMGCSDEYRINHWIGDKNIGFYINSYSDYVFLDVSGLSSKECDERREDYDWINGLHLLEERYILVSIYTTRDAVKTPGTINGEPMVFVDKFGYYDLIDTKDRKIYCKIPQIPDYSMVGSFKSWILTADHASIDDQSAPQNPTIQFYKLNIDVLN